MTHAQLDESPRRRAGAWAGWVSFAGVVLGLTGVLNLLQGFIALFDDGFFVVPREADLLLVDFSTWGAIMLLWGALMIAAGFSLVAQRAWARWFAVLILSLNVIVQIGFLSAFPIWSAIVILLDVLVIFALTARWDEAREAI